MYDTFEPFEKFEANEFDFYPSNVEIYVNGNKVINFFGLNLHIMCRVKEVQGVDRMIVVFPENLKDHLANTLFDTLISSNDRLVMLSLPQYGNDEKISTLSKLYGTTRPAYTFKPNEPYSCSVFLKNGKISKLSFNIYGKNKTVDLY